MDLIIGKRGSGKTYLSKQLMMKNYPDRKFVIIDINNQYGEFEYNDIIHVIENDLYNIRILMYPEYIDGFFKYMQYVKNRTLLFDEIDFFDLQGNREFDRFLINSRMRGNDIIATSRRPIRLNMNFVSQLDNLYAFKTYHPTDLAFIEKFTDKEWSEKLRDLKKYKYLKYQF